MRVGVVGYGLTVYGNTAYNALGFFGVEREFNMAVFVGIVCSDVDQPAVFGLNGVGCVAFGQLQSVYYDAIKRCGRI